MNGGSDMKLTPQAKNLWDKIPGDIQIRLLNNVYCTSCHDNRSIGEVQGTVEKRELILRGICTTCGGPVARLIESD